MSLFKSLNEPRPGQISSLDGLRALAITLVIASHSKNDLIHAGGLPTPSWLFEVLGYTWAGVDLFFILSGFLIGRIILQEITKTGTLRVGNFLLMRGLRIWPLYYFVCSFTLLKLFFSGTPFKLKDYIPDFLLLTNYYHERLAFGSWSLSVEEQFYLIASVVFLISSKWLKKSNSKITTHLMILFAIAPIIRHFTWSYYSKMNVNPANLEWDIIHNYITTHYDGLVLGLLFASVSVLKPESSKIRSNMGIALGGSILLSALLTYFFRIEFLYTLITLSFGSVVWHCLSYPTSTVARVFAWPGFQAVSRLSYGMYLWYRFPLWKIAGTTHSHLYHLPPSIQFFIIFSVTFLVAFLTATCTYFLIEQPFLALRSRLVSKSVYGPSSKAVGGVISS